MADNNLGHQLATPAQILNSYQLPDGSPDIQRRRAALLQLVNQLNFSDRRYVQDLVVLASAMAQDIITSLPIDMTLHISSYIPDPTDILAFRLVSRGWNNIWTNDGLMKAAVTTQFPNTLDREAFKRVSHDCSSSLEGSSLSAPTAAEFYRTTCRRAIRRQNGQYDSALAGSWRYPYDQNFELEAVVPDRKLNELPEPKLESDEVRPEPDQVKYSHGFLAWRFNHHMIVDNLRSLTRVIYDIPAKHKMAGPPPSIETVGDRLLVASMGRIVLVWDIRTHEMRSFTLPAPPLHCHVGGNAVGIVTGASNIFIYEFDGKLRELKIPGELSRSFGKAGKKRKRHIGIILDPELVVNGVVYLVSAHKPKGEEGMLYTVAMFKGPEFVKKWERQSFVKGGGWSSLRCTRANDSGMYTLLLESSEIFTPCQHFSNEHQFSEYYNHTWELFFDTRKQVFHHHHYHVPFADDIFAGLMDISDRFKTWGGRMILSLEHGEDMTMFSDCQNELHATSLVGSLPACDVDNDTVPFYRIGEPLRPEPTDIRNSRHPLLCCWDPCPDLELEFLLEPWKQRMCQRFDADDSFVITFGAIGYAAWRFDDAQKMQPTKRSENELRNLYGLPREDLDFYGGDDMDEDGWEDEDDDEDDDEDEDDDDDMGLDMFHGEFMMDDGGIDTNNSTDSGEDDSNSSEEDDADSDDNMTGAEGTNNFGNNTIPGPYGSTFGWTHQ